MARPKPLTPDRAKRTLAHKFGEKPGRPGLADRLRQLNTKFGLRSKRVFLVWTYFTGQTRGEGDEREWARQEILPTPKVTDLNAIALNPYSAGKLPIGTVRVTEISAAITMDRLVGDDVPRITGEHEVPDRLDFFYEVVEDGRGDDPPVRQRFRRSAGPNRWEGGVQWQVMLERSSEDRDRRGQSQIGRDADQPPHKPPFYPT